MKRLVFASLLASLGAMASAQFVVYSNTTNFTGLGYANGGAALQGSNTITTLVADDINSGHGGQTVNSFTFSVANFNTSAVSARPRVRFYSNDGASGGPGTLLVGFTFNPISFGAGSVGLYTANVANAFVIPTSGSFWAGITFDDNSGSTGATAAQLNNLGQGIFNPPTVGSSADAFFQTSAAGSHLANNPAGSFFNFGGNPVGNFGWAFSVPEPTSIAILGIGAAAVLRRRRRK